VRTNNHTLPSHQRLCSLFVAPYDSQGLRWRYSNPPPHGVLPFEVEVNLQPTVSQPVYLGIRRPSGTRDQFFFLIEISFRHLQVYYFVAPQTHLDLRHPTLGHSIHIQHRDPRTLSIKGPAHNRRCTVVCAEQSHPAGPPNDFRQRRNLLLKQPILHSSHHTSK
jgi:hypothetical protein